MLNLRLLALTKMPQFKNKSMLEIVNLCEENQTYKDVIFGSKNTILNFLDIFTIEGGQSNNLTMLANRRRQKLKCLLQLRYDLQTGNDCFAFMKAFSQGLYWKYERISNEDNEIGLCRPIQYPERIINSIKFIGTLPSLDCMGMQCEVIIAVEMKEHDYEEYKRQQKTFNLISVWKKDVDIYSDIDFKRDFYYNILCRICDLAMDMGIDDDPLYDMRVSLIKQGGGDVSNTICFKDLPSSIFLEELVNGTDIFTEAKIVKLKCDKTNFDDYGVYPTQIRVSLSSFPFKMS